MGIGAQAWCELISEQMGAVGVAERSLHRPRPLMAIFAVALLYVNSTWICSLLRGPHPVASGVAWWARAFYFIFYFILFFFSPCGARTAVSPGCLWWVSSVFVLRSFTAFYLRMNVVVLEP